MTDSRSTETTDEPMSLEEVAEQIVVNAKKADDYVIKAAGSSVRRASASRRARPAKPTGMRGPGKA